MRIFAVGLGALLLLGGGVLVVLADQQREAEVEHAQQIVADLEQNLDEAQRINVSLAEALTELRAAIAAREELLDDTDGFLE